MLGRGVVGYEVHNELHISLVHLANETLYIVEGTKLVHNIAIISNIVAIIVIRALITRAEPNCVYAEFL